MLQLKSILVYCGANSGKHPVYHEAAVALGKLFVEQNIRLVYGGGSVGLMGVIADTVLAAGGEVVGVIPQFLNVKEVGHTGCTELHEVSSMHERKALMEKLSDGVVVLPGGYGTFDEVFEMLTWSQLGLHRKPIGLLNIRNYYDHLVAQLDHMVQEGFLNTNNRKLLLEDNSPAELLEKMRAFDVPVEAKWLDSGSRT
jgi:uncharacterized protein (TIGR00730 family)